MRCGLITPQWGMVGATLAQADDHAQVEFFKAFAKEVNSYDTNWGREMQLAAISAKLTPEEREIFAAIGFMEKA